MPAESDSSSGGSSDLSGDSKTYHPHNGIGVERPLRVVDQFSFETRMALEAQGASIYLLTGQSIRDLREAEGLFGLTCSEVPWLETLPSRLSEVAMYPSELFLTDSNKKPMSEQLNMLERFGRDLARTIPGATVVLGSVSDYVELAFGYLNATGKFLFGNASEYGFTRTATFTGSLNGAVVGKFSFDRNLTVRSFQRDDGLASIWVAPLIVPTKK